MTLLVKSNGREGKEVDLSSADAAPPEKRDRGNSVTEVVAPTLESVHPQLPWPHMFLLII